MQHRAIMAVSLCCALVFAGCGSLNLRREPEAIQRDLLAMTPLGSSMEEVEHKLKMHHWAVRKSLNAGFTRHEAGKTQVIGVKSIWIYLGDYRKSPFETMSAAAYWGFDSNGRLIEIWVWKVVDSL